MSESRILIEEYPWYTEKLVITEEHMQALKDGKTLFRRTNYYSYGTI